MALTGKTIQHPNFHTGPSQDSPTTAVLTPDVPLQLIGLEGDYFRVSLPDGQQGYVHRDLVVVDGQTPPVSPPASTDVPTPPLTGRTTGNPRFHTEPSQTSDTIEVLTPGIPLQLVGLENSYWHVVLSDGRTGFVHTDLVRVTPGSGGAPGSVATISIRNPFGQPAQVTASSLEGHHTPYLGDAACDLDVEGLISRGAPVLFRASTDTGVAVRGRVTITRLSCAIALLENGGSRIQLALETQQPDGTWLSTGLHVNYAHLDPINVEVGDIVVDGFELGRLGPMVPRGFPAGTVLACGQAHEPGDPQLDEYHSVCAQHSHTHVEGDGGPWINHAGAKCGVDAEIMRFSL